MGGGGKHIIAEPLVDWMAGKASNVYTQFGEDGLIEAALDRIGETNRQCFEIGAADGLFFSNTLRLRQAGWKSVLIESDPTAFQKLSRDFGNSAICINRHVDDLDVVLIEAGMNCRPDFGVIDIDGQDYWMWLDMVTIRPRVMLVEHSAVNPSDAVPPRGESGQAGEYAIRMLGLDKGYTVVARTYCNLLFVDAGELAKCEH